MIYKTNWIKALGILSLLLLLFFVARYWYIYSEVQALKAPRFEQGLHKGALFCAECHREIYDEWSKRSLHALATAGKSFNDYLALFKTSFILNTFITDAACYSCHGEKTSTEGVNCEICHGVVVENIPIMETHKLKYKPGLQLLREEGFCIKCHELRSPLTLDGILTVPDEWRNSQSAAKGETCQVCHMRKGINGLSYHGFDTAHHDESIYIDDVKIQNAKLEFPRFSLEIENRITGHAIPPSGPTRVMVLEVIFLDVEGNEQYRLEEIFSKKFELMPLAGIFPNKLIKNTQLQSGERRLLNLTLPESLEGKINDAVATLRFYGVSDEYQGDIQKAHWISEPILREEFTLSSQVPD